ncbi:trifunctional histidinol dehydrogenase [Puccinia graminis f. sp. tritici]|uniref:Trifunctional histidinol dehydrogenase n=1 Tax=Puccinia graminis f. sp. tritici TaxID=56615 RepID=A0A5B0SLU5_PUCGR|nr:trifunctional histidinol dehydrogenase [Puccinia graminis f. sp. tritici]
MSQTCHTRISTVQRGSADTHTFHQTSNRSIILSNTNRLIIHHQVRHRSGSINHQLPNRLLKQPKKPPRGTIFTGLNLLCHTLILLAIDLKAKQLQEIQSKINLQAHRFSRIKIIKQLIPKSFIVQVPTLDAAFQLSNHLLLNTLFCMPKTPTRPLNLFATRGASLSAPFLLKVVVIMCWVQTS